MEMSALVSEIKKAIERGPVYVLVFAGAILLLGVDPSEFLADSSHALTAPEFITVNIVAGVLIIAAATISLFAATAAMRTLKEISTASSETAEKTMETFRVLAEKVSKDNTVLQGDIATAVLETARQLSGLPSRAIDGKPAGTAGSTSN
jgi:hypothetical protein